MYQVDRTACYVSFVVNSYWSELHTVSRYTREWIFWNLDIAHIFEQLNTDIGSVYWISFASWSEHGKTY